MSGDGQTKAFGMFDEPTANDVMAPKSPPDAPPYCNLIVGLAECVRLSPTL